MSEFNDFPVDVSDSSYGACLKAIEKADWFILLIGARVGGWFDENNKVSITRQEYRHAYQQSAKGKLRILTFVRREILDIAEDRKALAKWLGTEHQTSAERSVVNHPSKAMNDAEVTISFLDEVRRASDVKAAARDLRPFPQANWLFPLSGFHDIVDVVQREIGYDFRPSRVAISHNLISDLLHNLAQLLCRTDDGLVVTWMDKYLTQKTSRSFFQKQVELSKAEIKELAFFKYYMRSGFKVSAIERAIESGEFLSYDASSGEVRPTLIHSLLIELQGRLEIYLLPEPDSLQSMLVDLCEVPPPSSREIDQLRRGMLVRCLTARDRAFDVVNITRALVPALRRSDMSRADGLRLPKIHILGRDEDVTAQQVSEWIENGA